MLWRYIKAQLWVLLCGGLVGPIFLAIYFVVGPMVGQWMFWVGLLITAADVLIALALASYTAKSAAKTQALEQSGVLALAQVTGIQETGTRINEQPLVKLDLQISGPGLTPFASQDRVIASIARLPMIMNRKLVMMVDPVTNEYQIDWERSGLVSGVMPANFTIAEDNKTYDLTGQAAPLMEILQILQGPRHRFEQHDRSALQSGCPATGSGRRPARGCGAASTDRPGPRGASHGASGVHGATRAVDRAAAARIGDPARDGRDLRRRVQHQATADTRRAVVRRDAR